VENTTNLSLICPFLVVWGWRGVVVWDKGVGLGGSVRLREREGGERRGGSFLSSGAFTSRVQRPVHGHVNVFASIVFPTPSTALAEIYKEEARAVASPSW
jgi:hypothetical protein